MMTDRPPTDPPSSFVHLTAYAGHQQAYADLFGPMFDLTPSTGKIGPKLWFQLCRAKRAFFPTLDDDVPGFLAVSLMRSLIGRRTAGLFLHPNSCLERGMRAKVKYLLFFVLCRIPGVSVISILPFDSMPGMDRVATHCVHDPQLWDQVDNPPPVDPEVKARILALANGRPILAYLGWATEQKGFPFLARVVAARPSLVDDMLIIAAGKIHQHCQDAAAGLAAAGAVIWDRFVTDAEMAALYDVSTLVWVCYAPGYDQASGIFGRAIQAGRQPVIRDTATTIGNYVRELGVNAVALPQIPERAAELLVLAGGRTVAQNTPAQTLRQWKSHFIHTVEQALGGRH
jgi:hypothetical protein